MFHPTDFFDLGDPIANWLCAGIERVWQLLPCLESYVQHLTQNRQTIEGSLMPGAYLSDQPVYIAKGAIIEPGVYIAGPAYIGAGVVVRQGAYIRENVILLAGSLLGHASEAKNALFFPHAHAPHFNYVGDSILGNHVNLGAGTILSNLAITSQKDPQTGKRPTIHLTINGQIYNTELTKMGAILGDYAQTGCNAVLNPGCLVGKQTIIYPTVSLRKGYYPPKQLIKLRQQTEIVTYSPSNS